MLDQKGFDLWADGYDRAVGLSDEENSYPFAGYKAVLAYIFQTILEKPGAAVLDIGFGTGALAAKLYERGFDVSGQDFSPRMIELAARKMPNARLFQGD
ncbi:MAG: methyltransferase domain-containing protein, partial [Clostridia bacterium]|nr:methyltransferase domain-containing protein [Clostridia bacterium]